MPDNELHDLLFDNKDETTVEEVQALIDKYPNAVKEKDGFGSLPLHHAAMYGASKEVIQLLIDEYPDGVKEKDGFGQLPLHSAIGRNASLEVIQLLIKEYPDAVKEKDQDGNTPLSHPEIKEIYDRVITVVQNLTRSQGLRGDNPKGEDKLGVEEEVQAIAEIIAMKDLQPPFVVGILGGWGSGKTFTFNLIREYLKKIQKYDLKTEAVKDNFPYVGHIYPIVFSAWAYAMGCLWASLMHLILTSLNDQLDLEEVIGQELLKEGVSVLELMDEFTTSGELEYLKKVVQDESVQQALRKWKSKDGNITKALINATNSNYDDELRELAQKKKDLDNFTSEFENEKDKKKHKLAWEDVIAGKSTKISPEIKKLFKYAYEQYAAENPNDPVPQTVDAAIEHLNRWKGMFGPFLRLWDLFRAGKWSPVLVTVFLSSLIIALVLPLVLDKVGAAFTALGPFLSGIYAVFNNGRERLNSAKDVIIEIASETNLDKEQLQEAMEAAKKAHLRSDTNDEERQTNFIRDLNAEITALESRVWLREGDSLNKVVRDRLGSSNYEEHLGVVHQAQKDLQHISDAMLSNNKNGSFPRGDPRIVLFIDDLDRCPANKVVETLEAVQLLVNTDLFVVVLAIDAKYVTLCLEKDYVDILHPERHPSGLDYIEKIVQLPYRVPPISAEYMESYLQAQMNAKKTDEFNRARPNVDISAPLLSENASDEATSCTETPMVETTQSEPQELSLGAEESKRDDDIQSPSDNAADEATSDRETPMIEDAQSEPEAVPLPTEELDFTWEELESMKDVCVFSGVIPRSAKRLVNVFKLMKIIWHRREHTPETSMKHACLMILSLCASNSKRVQKQMCEVLAKIEQTTSMPACGNLKDFIDNALGGVDGAPLTKINSEKCNGIFEKVKWEDDEQWKLVKKDLRLLRSFSFVGEYNESVGDNDNVKVVINRG